MSENHEKPAETPAAEGGHEVPPAAPLRIKTSPRLAAMVAQFMADHDIRYYLNGVFVQRREEGLPGVYLVATNGSQMGVAVDEHGSIEGADEAIIRLEPETLRLLVRLARFDFDPKANGLLRGGSRATLERASGHMQRVVVEGCRLSVKPDFGDGRPHLELLLQPRSCLVEGRFPDWRRVMPHWDRLVPWHFGPINAALMEPVLRVSRMARRGEFFDAMTTWGVETAGAPGMADVNDKVCIQLSRVPELAVIVMPMREADAVVNRRELWKKATGKPAKAKGGP